MQFQKKSRKKRPRGKIIRTIARERMMWLFNLLDGVVADQPDLKQRYADLARKLTMKSRTRLPRAWRYRICRRCKRVLQPGINCRVRTRGKREKHVSLTCLECGWITRYVISAKNRTQRFRDSP
ncbi:MAG: ribonuclease P protein component 4 [Candidatus Heimdallarchaeota archaeon]